MSDNNKWNSTTRSDMEVLSAFVTEVQKRQPEATQIKKKAHEPKEIPVSLNPTDIDPLGNRVSAAGEISDTQYLSQIISGVERQTSGQKTQEEIDAIVREVLARMAADEQAKKDGTAVAVTQTQQVSEEVKEPVRKPDIIDVEAVEKNEEETPKKAKKKAKSGKGYYFGIGFFSFLNIAALVCFFVAYGPFNYLRDMFVTTAMRTMTHKYLANVLYSTETIQEILSANVTIEPDEVMDENAIHMNGITEEQTVFSSVYEEQVLKRDPGTLYKVQRLDEHGYKGYITFIYDPTHIDLAVTRYLGTIGEYVTKMAKLNNAHVAINGGGFLDYGGCGTGGQPTGYVIKHGKVVWTRNRGSAWGGGTIGFNQEGVLILTKKTGKDAIKKGVYNGVDFGPFLIVNGKKAEVSGNGGWGVHPRTVIGQRQDGIVVFLTVDGRSATSLGVDLNVCIDILERYDVYNAANLDGGASTVLAIEGKLKNKPVAYTATGEREVPTAWIVVD